MSGDAPTVDLTQMIVATSVLQLVPAEIARERIAFPFALDGDRLLVAMANPGDAEALEEIGFVASRELVPHLAPEDLILHVIDQAYSLEEAGISHFVGASVSRERLVAAGLEALAPSLPPAPPEPESTPEATEAEATAPEATAAEPTAPEPATASDTAEAAAASAASEPQPEAEPPAPKAAPLPQLSGKVLIAVADTEGRTALATMLASTGLSVTAASDGAGALERARGALPQLIVIEAVRPTLRGLELCRRLVSDATLSVVPRIVLTDGGWRLAEDLKESYGVRHVFARPYHRDPLLMAIRTELDPDAPAPETSDMNAEAATHWKAGMAAFEKEELERAVREFEAGVKADPEAFALRYHLGLMHGRRGDLFAAIGSLERALELQPNDFSAYKNMAVVCDKAGMRRMARECWERALEVAPDERTAASIRALIVEDLA